MPGSPVVITGVGAVTYYGRGVTAFAEALKQGRSAIRKATLPPFDGPRPAGLLPHDHFHGWSDDVLAPIIGDNVALSRHLRRAPESVIATAIAAVEAFRQSGLVDRPQDGASSGVIVGGQQLPMGIIVELTNKFAASREHLPPSYALHMLDTNHVGVVSALLGFRGEGFTVGGASASGGMALIQGAKLVRTGGADRCMVIGALADLPPMALQALDSLGALGGRTMAEAPELASRPFDAGADGFIYAQASGAVLLENREVAKARGAKILGELVGVGTCLDGTPLPTPSIAGEARSMRLALDDAGLEPSAIDTINAHGTASPTGDQTELEAINQVFGAHAQRLRVQSTKGLLGHSLWAAGVVEAVAVIAQMSGDFIHPNANLDQPIRGDVGLMGATSISPGPNIALSNSFGFGGINTSVVIARPREG